MRNGRRVATRLGWSFGAAFAIGLLMVGVVAYFELAVEPDDSEPVVVGVIEVAIESAFFVALISVVGWWLARRALRPVEELASAADRIHEGNLAEKISLPGSGEEFERLAEVFNTMTDRLHASFQRVRQFTLYASHELKTPLSILHAEFERMIDDPSRSDADRAHFARHLDEIERLSQIVDGLTFLAKADSNMIPLAKDEVAMQPLIESAAEDAAVLGTNRGINVRIGRNDPVIWTGDRHRLRQLLVILCDNGLNYNRDGGAIVISIEQNVSDSVLRVENTGPGIPPSDHDRVFERFYRGSSSLADGTEGCGLGLCIAQWITASHGGVLAFTSEPERTEFTATIPTHRR
jgi:signal transduction histidine kinase